MSGQMLGQMSGHCPDKTPPEIEIEKEREKDIEIEKEREYYISSSAIVSDGVASDKPKKAKPKKHKYGEYNNVLLTDTEYTKLCQEYGDMETLDAIKYLDEYIEMKGSKYKSHNLVLKKWVFDAVKEKRNKTQHTNQAVNNSDSQWDFIMNYGKE